MRLCLVLISCLFAPALFSQDPARESAPPQAPYVEREEREFNFFPGGKAEISIAVPGSVKVVGWKKSSVRVEVEKIVYYDTPEKAREFLKKSPVRIRHTETATTIRAIGTPEPPALLEINITVYLPGEKTDINAKLNRGDFSISSVNGWVEATIKEEGSLEAKAMAGYFSGLTQRGDITVEMSGIRWNGLEFAALTKQGSANLILPEKYSAALQLEARGGKITVNYPPRIEEGEEIPPEIVINKTGQTLKASVGDGGAPVRIVANIGDVTLSKLEQ